MITFCIDELVPCIKEVSSGEIYETEVVRVKRKSILSKFNKKTGWYVNWSKFSDDTEVYALVLKGTNDIQGMVAIQYDSVARAVYIAWGCVSPYNNVWHLGRNGIRFSGVGGHLLAIASELSLRKGFDGVVFGDAMSRSLCEHFCNNYQALHLPSTEHIYRIMFPEDAAKSIREVYSYEWTEDII